MRYLRTEFEYLHRNINPYNWQYVDVKQDAEPAPASDNPTSSSPNKPMKPPYYVNYLLGKKYVPESPHRVTTFSNELPY